MKQNVSGQTVGAQLVAVADGTAFTSAVTVYVTGDAGAQAIGSVGSGICTHEGNGYHSYLPAQAETNYAHIAFTFIGTGAIPSTAQVYTTFPQTGDVFPLASTEIADILAAVDTEVAAVKAKTDQLTFGTANRINAQVYGMEADTLTATAIATDAIGAAELAASAVTEIQAGLSTLDAAGVRTAVGLASANLDTQFAAVQSDTDNIQTRIPAALVSGRIDASVGAMAANTMTASALATDAVTEIQTGLGAGLDAAGVRAAVGLASANLDTQLNDLPTNAELATALGTADDAVLAAIAALNNLSQVNIRTAVGLTSANLDTQLDALPTAGELTTALASADDAILAAIAALNNLSSAQAQTAAAAALTAYPVPTAAQVNAEVVDALATDTYAEPGQGAPGATISLAAKIGYLFKSFRNLKTGDGTTEKLYGDDGTTVHQKATTSEAAGVVTKSEVVSGP